MVPSPHIILAKYQVHIMQFLIYVVRVLITIAKVWLLTEGDLSLPCRPVYCATEQTFELESGAAGLDAVRCVLKGRLPSVGTSPNPE